MSTICILPVKSFVNAKTRLSNVLSRRERVELAKAMLMDVLYTIVEAKEVSGVIVVTPGEDVERVASEFNKVIVINDLGIGQVEAVRKAMEYAGENFRVSRLILAVGDTPLITREDVSFVLSQACSEHSIAMIPSIDGGTNLMVQRPPGVIDLMYGPGSFRKHLSRALESKVKTSIYVSEGAVIDVDDSRDLVELMRVCSSIPHEAGINTCKLVKSLVKS